MRVRLIRAVSFRATHRLVDPRLSPDDNRRRFGAAADPHPHDYRCEVTLEGPVEVSDAVVLDLGDLDAMLDVQVTRRFHGKSLTEEVPPFDVVLPTCEGLAREIFQSLRPLFPPGITLIRVLVAEDASLAAECLAD